MSERSEAAAASAPTVVPATLLSWCLVAANAGVWLALEALGGSDSFRAVVAMGAKVDPLIDRGEYWRLLTSVFLHLGAAHLAFNCMALLTFGRLTEVIYGHLRFLAIYLVSGVAGATASYALTRGLSAGASGALFGAAGALVVFYARNRRLAGAAGRNQLTGYAFLLAINIFFGFVQPGIDNWAHLGGLAAGTALGLVLAPRLVATRVEDSDTMRVSVRVSGPLSWLSVPTSLLLIAAAVQAIRSTHILG